MASLYSRTYTSKKTGKPVTYWYVSYVKDGKRQAKSAGTKKSVAVQLKKRIEAELVVGKYEFLNKPGDIRIDASTGAYLDQTQTLLKKTTYTRYKNAIDNLNRFLPEKFPDLQMVRKLTPAHFETYKAWRRKDPITPNGRPGGKKKFPAFRTINNELGVFRSWLNWAITNGHAQTNILSGFEKLKTTDSKTKRTFTRDELERIFAASEAIEKEKPFRAGQTRVWRFLASTGLRIGELIHLQWSDIDFRREIIRIQRKADWDPKTNGREVPFTHTAAEVLQELKGQKKSDEDRIFTVGSGNPYRQNQARDWLLDCAKKAKVKDVRGPHDFRHTFTTMALAEFGPPIISKRPPRSSGFNVPPDCEG